MRRFFFDHSSILAVYSFLLASVELRVSVSYDLDEFVYNIISGRKDMGWYGI